MNRRSPFEFDMSVAADKRRRAKGRAKSAEVDSSTRVCEKPGCNRPGKYRAPKSPDHLDEFHWFCLDHVREYNLKWNYFESHSAEELERHVDSARVWDRPTRPFRETVERRAHWPHPEGRAWQRFGLDDPMDLLGERATLNPGGERAAREQSRRLPPTERRALDILDAREARTKSEVRRQYRQLVKDLHPDMNGGRRDDEERLAEVVWAWEQIKASRSLPD